MADTSIEWTRGDDGTPGKTWNPVTGCDQVSPGCGLARDIDEPGEHGTCYALTMAKRLKAMGNPRYTVDGDPRTSGPGFGINLHPDKLEEPLHWRKPRRVFVNSMSDLFHPRVPDEFIARVWDVMEQASHHTFQVLTKRPKRARSHLTARAQTSRAAGRDPRPAANIWVGTSVEDQQRADERIPALIETPAAVRFLSMEPLLGPVQLHPSWIDPNHCCQRCGLKSGHPAFCGCSCHEDGQVGWVIVGGESGPGARPMHPEWAAALRGQCEGRVPFFFKQWGAHGPYPREIGDSTGLTAVAFDGCHYPKPFSDDPDYLRWAREHDHTRPNRLHSMYRLGKKAAGRELDGRTWDEFPQAVTADA